MFSILPARKLVGSSGDCGNIFGVGFLCPFFFLSVFSSLSFSFFFLFVFFFCFFFFLFFVKRKKKWNIMEKIVKVLEETSMFCGVIPSPPPGLFFPFSHLPFFLIITIFLIIIISSSSSYFYSYYNKRLWLCPPCDSVFWFFRCSSSGKKQIILSLFFPRFFSPTHSISSSPSLPPPLFSTREKNSLRPSAILLFSSFISLLLFY